MGGKGSGRTPALKKQGLPVLDEVNGIGGSFFDLISSETEIRRLDAVTLNLAAVTFQEWVRAARRVKTDGTYTTNRFGDWVIAPWAIQEGKLALRLQSLLRELKATPATRAQLLKMAEEAPAEPPSLIDSEIGEEL